MRRALRIVVTALQSVLVVAALALAALLVLPGLIGWQVVTVLSGSMAPAYPVDAVLALSKVNPENVRVGDVIAFRTEADRPLVTHRVVDIVHADGVSFVTKGDANNAPDLEPVAASAVRGRVVFGVPHVGAFARAVRTPTGYVVLAVVPGLLLIGHELRTIRGELRARKRRRDDEPHEAWAAPTPESMVVDFWLTEADEQWYRDELDREVHEWSGSRL